MENQLQPPQYQPEIEKLRLQNAELKKNLEREQTLHAMLYKEWKELSEQKAAHDYHLYENSRPKNLFYKYGFFILILALIPAWYFYGPRFDHSATPSARTVIVPAKVSDTTAAKDSTTITRNEVAQNQNPAKTDAVISPAKPEVNKPAIEEKRTTAIDSTRRRKPVPVIQHIVEAPLSDAQRDSIYWNGWNDYFNKTNSHYRKSSEKYKAWLQGFNDGRRDARKVIAQQDSLKKQ